METPISTWHAAARSKWLDLESDARGSTERVRALNDKRSYLSISRKQSADHLKELENAVIRPADTAGFQSHENRIIEARAGIESLDALLVEVESQISKALASSQPKTRLAYEAKKILQKLGVISNLEASA